MKLKQYLVLGVLALQTNLFLAEKANASYAAFYQETTPPEDSTSKAPENWFHLDKATDNIRGVSTNKAYELLGNKPSRTIVVGVIDSGVDIDHEDLKSIIWTNEKEVAGNGVDDDKNGYVDDVHGWNFIGGKDGKNVDADTYELTREYVRLKKKFDGMKKIRKKDRAEHSYYEEVKKEYERKVTELKDQYNDFQKFAEIYKIANSLIKTQLDKEGEITAEDLEKVNATDEMTKQSKAVLAYALENSITEKYLEEAEEYFNKGLKFGYNTEFDPRSIVGDNYQNLDEKGYGNNDVKGPDPSHGTHVSGIIAADRKNNLGIMGIADNVKIMPVRAVPNGDERDKDIANAIYYAVDNGANIINMSFGKDYSPNKEAVDKAVKYAESKGVLLIHAAGNDGENLDEARNFPTRKLQKSKDEAKNWLEIGASSWGDNTNFVGNFSNYGKSSVDLFAPGVDIYSTTPDQKYENKNGTSMAAPVASGVAALLMSYFPDLTAEQVKDIVVKSVIKYSDAEVNKPGGKKGETISFTDLSITGGIVNALEAVKMAQQITTQK
jgi:subtilisin family serine protease